jgi:glucose/arabinose dehydrogenase
MRHLAWSLALFAACGGSKAKKDDAGPGKDGSTIDAPMLPACSNPVNGMTMSARMIGRVSGGAMLATSPPADTRLFVVEQNGRIRVFQDEQLVATPYMDISSKLVAGGEQGLLGLAFHPNFAQNGKFYVFYTANNPAGNPPFLNVLEQYTAATPSGNTADPATGQVLISIPDPFSNHNAGMIEFGGDGYLYISTGDGGSGGDPLRNAQNKDALLGKVLRIDVDHPAGGKPYGIPTTNPFAAGGGAPEVFILGVRNPWRWSFDRLTGDMWIGDVGQVLVEELDVLKPGEQAGANLGWSMWEADNCYGNYTCSMTGMKFPQAEWWHANTLGHPDSNFRAIIGGQVYRGTCYPDIQGYYFFTDNNQGAVWRAHLESNGTVTTLQLPAPMGGTWPASPASIHADARGELYETDTAGYVYHLEAGP